MHKRFCFSSHSRITDSNNNKNKKEPENNVQNIILKLKETKMR